jgi:D-glycero-D-manno-heptose 1,7-bisphosphate phosphatase
MSNKAIFLDRDDTLIEDPGYINNPNQVKLLNGAAEALIEFRAMGYKIIVASNQSGVARGIVTEKILGEIHNRLKHLLVEKGAYLDKIYYCPYHPDGSVAKYRKESDHRKPNPGMLLDAAKKMNIDLNQSWMIGNSSRDIEAGSRAGCKTILINRPLLHYEQPKPGEPKPDYKAINIKEAVNIVKQYHRLSDKCVTQPSVPTEQLQPVVSKIEERFDCAQHEQANQPEPEPPQTSSRGATEEQEIPTDSHRDSLRRTEQLLGSILSHVKGMHRTDMFGEFSMIRFIAGVVQIIVLLCLLLTIWFLISPNRQNNAVFISLGFAMVLQVMALTFYIMQKRR